MHVFLLPQTQEIICNNYYCILILEKMFIKLKMHITHKKLHIFFPFVKVYSKLKSTQTLCIILPI